MYRLTITLPFLADSSWDPVVVIEFAAWTDDRAKEHLGKVLCEFPEWEYWRLERSGWVTSKFRRQQH